MPAGFLNNLNAFLLPAFVLLMFAWLRLRLRDRLLRLEILGLPSGKETASKVFVPGAVLCLILLSLARPFAGREEVTVTAANRDILVLLDISLSMLAEDSSAPRIEVARRKLLDLVSLVERDSRGDRIGLVLFAGESRLFCPLTADYPVLRNFINAVGPEAITEGGSDISQAIQTAMSAIERAETASPLILIVSDGEDLNLNLEALASTARDAGIRINALGIGGAEAVPIKLPRGNLVRDASGKIVMSRLNEQNLSHLAVHTSGKYRRATVDDSDIVEIINSGSVRQGRKEEKIDIPGELGPWILLACMLALIYFFATGRYTTILPLLAAGLLCQPGRLLAQDQDKPPKTSGKLSLYEAGRAYQEGDYQSALEGFSSAREKDPADPKIIHGLAATHYRLGDYSKAIELYSELAETAKSGRGRYEGLFNRGNAQVMNREPQAAVSSFEEALKIKPADENTLKNLEFAKKMAKELEQEQPPASAGAKNSSKDREDTANSGEDAKQNPEQDRDNTPQPADPPESSAQQESPTEQENLSRNSSGRSREQPEQAGSRQNPSDLSPSESDKDEAAKSSREDTPGKYQEQGDEQRLPGQQSRQNDPADGREPESSSPSDQQAEFALDHKRYYDPAELKEKEARAWLDSLPDSPVLLYRKNRNRSQKNQTW